MALKDDIRADRTYRIAKKSLDHIKTGFDSKQILNELFNLQASRGVSALKPNKILQSSLQVLLDSTTQEITVRSRVTTIKMTALRSLLSLDQIIDPLRKYILYTYRNAFKTAGITGVTNQKNVVDDILKLFLREKRDLDYIMKIADLVSEDTDKAGFGLKRIQEVLETSSRDR